MYTLIGGFENCPSNNLHLVRPWTSGCHACEHSCETNGGVCDEKKEVQKINVENVVTIVGFLRT